MKKEELPIEIRQHFGEYGPRIYDSNCGECIGWGYAPKGHLGEELFAKCGEYGKWSCVYPSWFLITKWLTPAEAEEKYGKVTGSEYGPRGGFKSVTYGEKTFVNRELQP